MMININLGFLTQSDLFAEHFTLVIEGNGYRDATGKFCHGKKIKHRVKGNVEPYKGERREGDVSGQSLAEMLKISMDSQYLVQPLAQGTNPKTGDQVMYKDKTYLITSVADWSKHGFIDVICKLDSSDDANSI